MATTTDYSGARAARGRLARIFYTGENGEDRLVDFNRDVFIIGRTGDENLPTGLARAGEIILDEPDFALAPHLRERLTALSEELAEELLNESGPVSPAELDSELLPFYSLTAGNACLIPDPGSSSPAFVDDETFQSAPTTDELSSATLPEVPDLNLPIPHVFSLRHFNSLSEQLSQCDNRDALFEALQNSLAFVFPTAEISFSPNEQFDHAESCLYQFTTPLISGQRVHGWCRVGRRECDFQGEEIELLKAAIQQAGMTLEVIRLAEERQQGFDRMIKALALTLDARDEMTAGHSARVANYSMATARHLELSAHEQKLIYYAALLHDYGKIGVRDEVLCKPGNLTPEEFEHIRQHSYYTFRILSRINFGEEMAEIPLIASSHHERPDGRGYPRGLRGEEIHIGARIIAVTDFFDALTSVRHYRQPMPLDEVMGIIEAGRDTQFDGRVIDGFRCYYEQEYRPRRMRSQQHQAATQPAPHNSAARQS
jgi:HD-GYP domain-containing protein (c-di-GMP phosphodiesterase class II)